METVQWKVDGMDCTNCALTIRRYLEKEGMKNVKVNFGTGDVAFEMNGVDKKNELAKGLKGLGYPIKDEIMHMDIIMMKGKPVFFIPICNVFCFVFLSRPYSYCL
jgi:copper chaperone CopZ